MELFEKAGGIANVYEYYKKRAKLYDFPPEISVWTQFTLVRSAIRENKIDYADKFIKEFGHEFINKLRADRIILIAQFYLDNQHFEQAKKIYSIAANLHPDLASAFNGLGHVYVGLNDKDKAVQHFKTAVDLATKVADGQLIQYQKDLTEASNL